ncbi:MAG: DUF485 domain-containing protein [Acidobacteria bacterium]|nr:DUF485 domain-containing protein [Acidobacteriota bacterium]
MFHEPAKQSGRDPASGYKTRIGIWMFFVYALIYAGFVAVNVISPNLMEAEAFLGLNVSVAYGFFLIVFALILALVYNGMCTAREKALEAGPEGKER